MKKCKSLKSELIKEKRIKILKSGLIPKFVEIDLDTFNFDLNKLRSRITSKLKAVMAVQVLGNSSNMIKLIKITKKYLDYLNKKGVETRPIISGGFLNQHSIKLYGLNKNRESFPNAQDREDRGFFIGLHTKKSIKRN